MQGAAELILQFIIDLEAAGRRGAALAALQQAANGLNRGKAQSEIVRATRAAMLVGWLVS